MGDDDLDFTSARKKDSSLPNRKSVHQSLGGGAVADVLLWKRWSGGAFLLVAASAMWFLFERAGYSFLSLIANVLLLLVVILFFWAKSASLLNRPLPPIPNMGVSEEFVGKGVNSVGIWINRVLAVASEIYLEGNVKLFFQVVLGLWIISCIGSLFNFLTLVYIVLTAASSLSTGAMADPTPTSRTPAIISTAPLHLNSTIPRSTTTTVPRALVSSSFLLSAQNLKGDDTDSGDRQSSLTALHLNSAFVCHCQSWHVLGEHHGGGRPS
ncbi:hypothetical protein HHK36_008351 [Tetracentron sinense]|uniref:Reticulon-like protein n=1 Tax=Tetracentron sinense TaxID=13715 RepID=A0A834ZMB8_TETSI|nr:hypothetical protein HHK36_008351 [Tetracentron sinense]